MNSYENIRKNPTLEQMFSNPSVEEESLEDAEKKPNELQKQ